MKDEDEILMYLSYGWGLFFFALFANWIAGLMA